jgi:hypothetical protein
MTASVEFTTGSAKDVLLVANSALRYRPAENLLAGGQSRAGITPTLWVAAEQGRVRGLPVRTGLTDGQRTVVEGEGVTAGLQVITGVTREAQSGSTTSPFQSNTRRGGPPGGGPPM